MDDENPKKKGRPKKKSRLRTSGGQYIRTKNIDTTKVHAPTNIDDHDDKEKVEDEAPVRTEEEEMKFVRTGDVTEKEDLPIPVPEPSPLLTHSTQKENNIEKPTHIEFTTDDEEMESDVDEGNSIMPEDSCGYSDSDSDSDSYSSSDEDKYHGNRILPFESLTSKIRDNLSCQFCFEDNVHTELINFVDFLEEERLLKNMNEDEKKKIVRKFVKNIVKRDTKKLELTEQTVGIATQLKIFCPNCNRTVETDCERSVHEPKKERYNANETFAINVMLVLGLQQIGGGGSDAFKLLTFLNLPNGKSMKDNKFKRIEDSIGNVIRDESKKSLQKALEEEVLLTLQLEKRDHDFKKWKMKELEADKIGIVVSYDMGWNKRSTGTRYDSISGHGVAIGQLTKKVVGIVLFSKQCSVCDAPKNKNKSVSEVPAHICVKNHDGSSKAMESRGIHYLFVDFWENKKVWIKTIVSDDDSSMRSQMRHSYRELINNQMMTESEWPKTVKGIKKPDKGKLPIHMKPPNFVADPNHRVKVFGKHIYDLAKSSKKISEVDKPLAQRMKEYWGKMLSQIRNLNPVEDERKIEKMASAPLEHVFDNHENCGDWCYKKKAMTKGDIYVPPPNRPFYSKEVNSKMYNQIREVVQNFNGMDTLKESIHSYDTQKNEALNQCISRVAPKFKHFGATLTLHTRIHLVIAMTNEGYANFYTNLLPQLVNLNKHNNLIVQRGIHQIEKLRRKNLTRKSSTDFKRSRKHKTQAKISEQVYEERISERNNYGTYESGFNFEPEEEKQTTIIERGQDENANKESEVSTQEQGRGTSKRATKQKYCKWCNTHTNHTTRQSKSCSFHNEWLEEQKNKKKGRKKLTVDDSTNTTNKEKEKVSNAVYDYVDVAGSGDGIRSGDDGAGALDLLCVAIENESDNGTNKIS